MIWTMSNQNPLVDNQSGLFTCIIAMSCNEQVFIYCLVSISKCDLKEKLEHNIVPTTTMKIPISECGLIVRMGN